MGPHRRVGRQTFALKNHRLRVKRTARRISAEVRAEFMSVTKL